MKKLWLIIDEKPGNANQAISVANALGLDYEIKKLSYNYLGTLPNRLKFNSLLGVDLKNSDNLSPPYPDLIISSGRKTAAVNNYLKRQSDDKIFSVHLMQPDLPFDNFDLICLPLHDMKSGYKDLQNIIYTIGAPTWKDPLKLQEAGEKFKENIAHLKPPFISVMIGGKTKEGDYSLEEMQELLDKASGLANQVNGSLLITNSRRTSSIETIIKSVKAPYFFYDWHNPASIENPYSAFLYLSDYFIVTGDSVSICSEALATGKPVYIYRKDKLLSLKHRKFLDYLAQLGYTRLLDNEVSLLENWQYQPLQEAQKICQLIRNKCNAISAALSIKNS